MAEATGFEPASLTTNRFQGGFLTTRTASIYNNIQNTPKGQVLVSNPPTLPEQPYFFCFFLSSQTGSFVRGLCLKASSNSPVNKGAPPLTRKPPENLRAPTAGAVGYARFPEVAINQKQEIQTFRHCEP
jgi:hypothetical protein